MALALRRWGWRRGGRAPRAPATASLGMHMVLVMLAASVPLALMLVWQLAGDLRAQQQQRDETLQRSANALASSVERELVSTLDLLNTMSHQLGAGDDRLPALLRALEAHPRGPAWRQIYLRAADGGLLFHSGDGGLPPPPDGSSRIFDLQQADGHAGTAVEVPLIADNGARFRLGAWIDGAHWQALAQAGGPPSGGFLSVYGRDHRVIARSNLPGSVGQALPPTAIDAMAGQTWGAYRGDLVEGGASYAAWQTLPLSGWVVDAAVPAAPLDRAQRRATLAALATSTACLLLGLALATLVARRVTEPLRRLVTHGNAATAAPVVREIAQLQDALASARRREAVSRATLQRKADDFEALFNGTPIGLAFASVSGDAAQSTAINNTAMSTVIDTTAMSTVIHNPAMNALIGPASPLPGSLSAVGVFQQGLPLALHEQPLQRAAAQGEPVGPVELELRYGSGATRHVLVRATPLLDEVGRSRAAVAAMMDITERKHAEHERAALVASEREARQQAEAASRAKDEFLAMLGHELRNPLGAIASAVEVLQHVDGDAARAADARQIIARQTRHLARLMDDLLDVGRVVSGKVLLQRRPLDLAALVRNVCAALDVTGASKRHGLRLQLEPVWAEADATRLEQVLTNLLGNAFKYTPAGREVRVHLRRERRRALLDVSDRGDGIDPALLPHIFDLFVQGERPLARRAGGLGIGLTLVRRLVELHDGEVSVRSSSQGTTFCVDLPAIEPPADVAVAAVPGARSPRRVLVVEDNADALSAMRSLMALDGHSVATAADGEQGLAVLLRERPDAAIVDIGLPGLSGYELAQRSRRAGYAGKLFAVSGYGSAQTVAAARRHGFDDHLAKPIDPERLRELLAQP
jgi:signal transduction histidine kinase/CheY-like chemotaxis protein